LKTNEPNEVSHKPTKCQICDNQTVVEIVYGDSTEEAWQLSADGKLVLGACVILGNSPDWEFVQYKTRYSKMSYIQLIILHFIFTLSR